MQTSGEGMMNHIDNNITSWRLDFVGYRDRHDTLLKSVVKPWLKLTEKNIFFLFFRGFAVLSQKPLSLQTRQRVERSGLLRMLLRPVGTE